MTQKQTLYFIAITMFVLIIVSLTSCYSFISKDKEKLIISSIEKISSPNICPCGLYRIKFDNNDLIYYTDSLYQVGDSLKLVKIK